MWTGGYSLTLMAVFFIGLVLTVCSAYFYARDRKRSVAGAPLWALLLLSGLALTFVIPAMALFIGSVAGGEVIHRLIGTFMPPAAAQTATDVQVSCYIMAAPSYTPPTPTLQINPTCYTPIPPSPTPQPIPGADTLTAIGGLGAAGIAALRKDLLEQLRREGRIPERICDRLQKK